MSNNTCLITQLTGSVSDDSLPKFGEMIFDLVQSSSVRSFKIMPISGGGDIVVTAIGGYLVDSDGESNPSVNKTVSYTGSTITLYVDGSVTRIKLSNKKALRILETSYLKVDLEELQYLPNLKRITLSGDVSGDVASLAALPNFDTLSISNSIQIYGDIESLSEVQFVSIEIIPPQAQILTGLQGSLVVALQHAKQTFGNLYIYRCPNITGDITDALGSLINVTNFDVSGTSIDGDLKELADAWYAAGRVSGTCRAYGNPGVMLFNGEPMPTRGVKFTFSSSGWTSETL